MKILKEGGYVVHHNDGSRSFNAREYEVKIDGQDLSGVCCGANEEEHWADVFVQNDGSPDGYAGPRCAIPPFTLRFMVPTRVVRLNGDVTITRRQDPKPI